MQSIKFKLNTAPYPIPRLVSWHWTSPYEPCALFVSLYTNVITLYIYIIRLLTSTTFPNHLRYFLLDQLTKLITSLNVENPKHKSQSLSNQINYIPLFPSFATNYFINSLTLKNPDCNWHEPETEMTLDILPDIFQDIPQSLHPWVTCKLKLRCAAADGANIPGNEQTGPQLALSEASRNHLHQIVGHLCQVYICMVQFMCTTYMEVVSLRTTIDIRRRREYLQHSLNLYLKQSKYKKKGI